MKRRKSIILTTILLVILVACGDKLGEKSYEKGLEAIGEQNYEKALLSFEVAIEEGYNTSDVIKIKSEVETYIDAKSLVDMGSYEEALVLLERIDLSSEENIIETDISKLKEEIKEKIQAKEDLDSEEIKILDSDEGIEEKNLDKNQEEIKEDIEVKEEGVIGTTNPMNNPNKPTFKKYSSEYYRNETPEQRENRIREKKETKRKFVEDKRNRYR